MPTLDQLAETTASIKSLFGVDAAAAARATLQLLEIEGDEVGARLWVRVLDELDRPA